MFNRKREIRRLEEDVRRLEVLLNNAVRDITDLRWFVGLPTIDDVTYHRIVESKLGRRVVAEGNYGRSEDWHREYNVFNQLKMITELVGLKWEHKAEVVRLKKK